MAMTIPTEAERQAHREQLNTAARAFFDKHAFGPLAAPSCFVCGDLCGPPAVQHLELPGVVCCARCKAASEAAKQGNTEITSDGWVPVSERLPEEDSYVLAVEPAARPIDPFIPTVARYTTKGGRHMLQTAWIDSTGEYIDVSHWQPLPARPCNVKDSAK